MFNNIKAYVLSLFPKKAQPLYDPILDEFVSEVMGSLEYMKNNSEDYDLAVTEIGELIETIYGRFAQGFRR